jgi:hypothetical protein
MGSDLPSNSFPEKICGTPTISKFDSKKYFDKILKRYQK